MTEQVTAVKHERNKIKNDDTHNKHAETGLK